MIRERFVVLVTVLILILLIVLSFATFALPSETPNEGEDLIAYSTAKSCEFDQDIFCPGDLVLFSLSTGSEELIPVSGVNPEGFAWSPNHQYLAFLDNDFRYNLLDISSMSTRILSDSPIMMDVQQSRMQWSPDGTQIAIAGAEPGNLERHLLILNADRGELLSVAQDQAVTSFDWSPNGERIAFTALGPEAQNDIYILEVNSNEVTQLTEDNHSYNPDWSSNGDKIVYVSRQGEDRYLYMMDITTGDAELVSRSGGDVPFWVLNDTHILYSISSGFRRSDFVLLNLDTGTENRLISVETLSGYDVSPDKTRVAFITVENNAAKLCVLNLNSADIQCAITPAFAAGRPAWGY